MRRRWLAFVIALLAVLTLGVVVLHNGPVLVVNVAGDVTIPLDGGWRVLQGQTPYTDFHSIFGPVYYLFFAAGMKVAGANIHALPVAVLLMLAVTFSLAWLVAWRRMTPVVAVVFTLVVALLVTGASPLGFPVGMTSYAELYNRLGFALFAVLLAEVCLIPRRAPTRVDSVVGGMLAGVVLWSLAFMKITFFAAAVPFLLAQPILRRPRHWYLGLFLGSAVVLLPILAHCQWNLAGIGHDILLLLNTRHGGGGLPAGCWMLAGNCLPASLALLAMVAVYPSRRLPGCPTLPWWQLFVMTAGIYFAELALTAMNYQPGQVPFFIGALIMVEYILRYLGAVGGWNLRNIPVHGLIICLCAAVVVLPDAAHDLRSLQYAARGISAYDQNWYAVDEIHAPPFHGLPYACIDGMESYPGKINDGLSLLRSLHGPPAKILTLDFTNPFSFALQQPSPRGDAVQWQPGATFSTRAFDPAAMVFHDVHIVMAPIPGQKNAGDTVWALRQLYGPYLTQHYTICRRSNAWTLYVRNDLVGSLR